MRTAEIKRDTFETKISLKLNLDGEGKSEISSGNGFLDHILTLFAKHAGFDLAVKCDGDLNVDCHHTAEDIGIALGSALCTALGDKRGITRYGDIILPMDEALVLAAIDISGRGMLSCELELPSGRVGEFDTELCEEFWVAFAREAKITLHIRQLAGRNSHHIIEAVFKACGRILRAACAIDASRAGEIPSTKGVL